MALDTLINSLASDLESSITERIEKRLDDKLDALAAGTPLVITSPDGTKRPIKGIKHSRLPQLITIASKRLPVLLVGSAGTGKTHAAIQVAEALSLPHYAISVGAQTSKADLLGYMSASGIYVSTMFRLAYENGGVFLMDEIDAGNANVLVALNAALSNGSCGFPDGVMVPMHPNFVFIASANTYGLGASRQYVGRNQLDASTLDRFVVLEWDIDNKLEASFVPKTPNAKKWYTVVKSIRSYVERDGIRALVTPRATIKGVALLDAGLNLDDTLQATILAGMATTHHDHVRKLAREAWGRDADITVIDRAGIAGDDLATDPDIKLVTPADLELTEAPF